MKWLGYLTVVLLTIGLVASRGIDAHAVINLPLEGGWDARAACDAGGSGNWTFTVSAITGKVSKVNVQIYADAHPTYSDGELRVCSSSPDPFDRPQELCPDVPDAPVPIQIGSVTINKPKVGKSGALSLSAGTYCVRVTGSGKGSVDVSVSHP